MATSSIFADFEIKDPKAVRVFVDALCSDKPWPQPKVKVTGHFSRDPSEIRAFFEKGVMPGTRKPTRRAKRTKTAPR